MDRQTFLTKIESLENVTDDTKIELMENVTELEDVEKVPDKEFDSIKKELESAKNELSTLKEKYKERFLSGEIVSKPNFDNDIEEVEEKNVINIKEI